MRTQAPVEAVVDSAVVENARQSTHVSLCHRAPPPPYLLEDSVVPTFLPIAPIPPTLILATNTPVTTIPTHPQPESALSTVPSIVDSHLTKLASTALVIAPLVFARPCPWVPVVQSKNAPVMLAVLLTTSVLLVNAFLTVPATGLA